MSKFFVNGDQIKPPYILISGEDVSHITKVLRMKIGENITLCDGNGMDYSAVIKTIDKTLITAEILDEAVSLAEPETAVTLYQALPKQGKMEYIIQKTTELGIVKIVPVYTKYCVVKPSDKKDRWQKVAEEAAKQSGRGKIPEVCDTIDFKMLCSIIKKHDIFIMLYEKAEEVHLKDVLADAKGKDIGFLVGSEGGFSQEEMQQIRAEGAFVVSLGNRILRTETVGIAVQAIIMNECGDL